VVVTGQESAWRDVISGVPQGSVLGPILFLIYINDIVDNLNCPAYLFADDMKIFSGASSRMDSVRLQADLDTVVTWTKKWLLKLNAGKCKVLTLGRADKRYPFTYRIQDGTNNQDLSSSLEEKDLGVLVDSNLKFDTHTSTVKSRLQIG